MENQDLDQLIDEAARGIVQREPSRALTAAVMERVRRDEPSRRRPLLWGGALAASAAAAWMVVSAIHHTPPIVPPPPESTSFMQAEPAPQHPAQPEPATSQNFVFERKLQDRPGNAARPAQATDPDMEIVLADSITIDPIEPTPIEIPQIETARAPVDEIHIDPLEIEPLSASDD